MKRKKKQGRSLGVVIVFCVFVACLVLVSLSIKALILIKDSSFDGQHRFNLEVHQGKDVSAVVSFSPKSRSISILNLKGKLANNNLGQYLSLPIDAVLKISNRPISKSSIASDMSNVFFHYDGKDTSLTIIDALKLWFFAKDIPTNFIYQRDLSAGDTLTISSFVSSFFIDPVISNEKTTIEIVNATSVYGLANRFAILIANIGGDVVLVSSADKVQDSSQILYSGDLNYTIKKLSAFLGVKPVKALKRDISDVTIILGKDILQNLNF